MATVGRVLRDFRLMLLNVRTGSGAQTAGSPLHSPALRRLRIAMGTWLAIEAAAASESVAQAGIDKAFAAVSEIEQRMHPRRDGSDLVRISRSPLHAATNVHPMTWQVLQLAKRVSDLTDGAFDPCLPSQPGRLADIALGPEPQLTCHKPVALDLGGVAKGYAIDRAIDVLRASGCTTGLVNAGGDLRIFGPRREKILLRRADGTYQHLELEEAALAVSDLDAANRPTEHQGYYIRGEQAAGSQSSPTRRYAAVIAQEAATADALTKCVLLCSAETAARALLQLGARSVA